MNTDKELKPCPFCGEVPDFPTGDGTQYEIECCECGQAVASVQIRDLMDSEERLSDNFVNDRYAEKYIERAKMKAIDNWNTRDDQAALEENEALRLEITTLQMALEESEAKVKAINEIAGARAYDVDGMDTQLCEIWTISEQKGE